MTPFHLTERVAGFSEDVAAQYRQTLFGAWHAAALGRVAQKDFPSLGKLLTPADQREQKPQGVDEAALKIAFEQYNEKVRLRKIAEAQSV